MDSIYLGIDIGGSGIKSALVDLDQGRLITDRRRVDTPQPSTPESVAEVLRVVLDEYEYEGPVGIGFPSVIRHGVAETANNIDHAWIGRKVGDFFGDVVANETVVINDADAAAMAEARYGAASGVEGLVLTITFGTGIGSGLLVDGELVPNLELGQIELEGHIPAESYFSAKARRRDELEWDEWGERANRFLRHVNAVFNPKLMVVGGGLTKHWELYADQVDESLPVVPATMGNSAGIVGAALAVSRLRTG
ncbi:MAG: polyphosphate--glucose phosphotransferase [Acidimicrobiia bacterium]